MGGISLVCEEEELTTAWHMCTFYIQTGTEFAGWARVLYATQPANPLTIPPPQEEFLPLLLALAYSLLEMQR